MKKSKFLIYLNYVFRHKCFVFLECLHYGLLWQGLIHDWHKFLPDEFIPYMHYFGGGINTSRDKTGYYKPTDTGNPAFDMAWFRHQKRAKHHWQYWIVPEYDSQKALEIPRRFALEMIADWRGAGRAQNKPDTLAWYIQNKDKMVLHPNTRKFIENEIE
jgi:hypothetical protein